MEATSVPGPAPVPGEPVPAPRRHASVRGALDVRLALAISMVSCLGIACASGPALARSFRLDLPGGSARAYVPKAFEPLVPGSVYPNRRKPVEARRRAVAVVAAGVPGRRALQERLLERGFLVVEERRPSGEPVTAVADALAGHPEADPSRICLVVSGSISRPLDPRVRAVVVFDPESAPAGPPEPGSPGPPVAAFLRTPRQEPSPETSRRIRAALGASAIERWYEGTGGFPRQALRDAAEWLVSAISGLLTAR
jgi:hypothetical protein